MIASLSINLTNQPREILLSSSSDWGHDFKKTEEIFLRGEKIYPHRPNVPRRKLLRGEFFVLLKVGPEGGRCSQRDFGSERHGW
jgi:hypothetical protein